jgi:hypothetical protein
MHTAPARVSNWIAIPWALTCALSFACAQSPADAAAKTPPPDAPALRNAIHKAIAWIERQAVPVEGNGEGHADAVTFPGTAEEPDKRSAIVYGGGAGVLIFLENAAKVLGDQHVRALADRTANGLLATARKDEHGRTWANPKMPEGAAALYVGDAGVGAAFSPAPVCAATPRRCRSRPKSATRSAGTTRSRSSTAPRARRCSCSSSPPRCPTARASATARSRRAAT